jgi:hypothetical protein
VSAANPRLVKALAYMTDAQKKAMAINAGVLCEDDFTQAKLIMERSKTPVHIPLYDKVISECDLEIENCRDRIKQVTSGLVKIDPAENMDRITGLATACASEIFKYKKDKLIGAFSKHNEDTGTIPVQGYSF